MLSLRNIRHSALLAALVACLALAFGAQTGSAAQTCSKYASPTGSDSAAGTEAAPFKTAQELSSSLSAGQTGCLRGGTYTATGTYVLSPTKSGTSSAPIVITSYPGERARLVGIVNIASGVNDVTLSNLSFEGTGEMNTIKIYSTDVRIEDSEITNAWRGLSCMMLGSNSAGQALRPVISGNVFHACGSLANGNKDHGIYAANAYEGKIVNNVFYDSAAYAVQLYPNSQRTVFAHNVVDGSAPSVRGGVVFGGDETYASSENVVEKNIIAYAETYDISSVWGGAIGSGNIARENCLWSGKNGVLSNAGGLTSISNLTANPEFRNRSAHDYELGPDSPCLTEVGYDTVAMLAANGVQLPSAEPEPEPAPVTPAPVTTPPGEARPLETSSVKSSSPQSPKKSGHKSGRSSKQSSRDRLSFTAKAVVKGGAVSVHVSGRVNSAVSMRAVLIQVAEGSSWRQAAQSSVLATGHFQANLRVASPQGGGEKLSLRAVVPGVGHSPVARI